jgi:2-pyrone-4,6-dicarboxylate lactonase
MSEDGRWISEPTRPVERMENPRFTVPNGACDAHMHVFGPAADYPSSVDAKYTLPQASVRDYARLAMKLNIGRMVLVQPSFYGADNSYLVHALRMSGSIARGVVFLPDDASTHLIDQLHEEGVRGVRLDLFKAQASGLAQGELVTLLKRTALLARAAGWHVELYSPGRVNADLLEELADLKVDFSIAHMGYFTREEGLTDADFQRFLKLLASPHCWVKLTGAYRVSRSGESDLTDWMARELIAAAPNRVIWGTDWPHIPACSMDTGEILNRLAIWCPDAAARDRVLVDNPARLYQFGAEGA